MPHIVTFDGLIARQPGFQESDEFIKLGDIKGEFQADELTGGFDALNETTNFDPKILGPISGNGVFKTQDIDAKGSVIWGDNHFTPDRGGDSLMGMRNPGGPIGEKTWTNGGASTFEDRLALDFDANDAVFDMRQNIGITSDSFGCGDHNPISTGQPVEAPLMHQGAMNSVWLKDLAGNMTETFEPAAGMNSFGESLNPVLEVGTNSGPGGTTYMTGSIGCQTMPPCSLTGSADPGGDDI